MAGICCQVRHSRCKHAHFSTALESKCDDAQHVTASYTSEVYLRVCEAPVQVSRPCRLDEHVLLHQLLHLSCTLLRVVQRLPADKYNAKLAQQQLQLAVCAAI
jgi:hypothetical protein